MLRSSSTPVMHPGAYPNTSASIEVHNSFNNGRNQKPGPKSTSAFLRRSTIIKQALASSVTQSKHVITRKASRAMPRFMSSLNLKESVASPAVGSLTCSDTSDNLERESSLDSPPVSRSLRAPIDHISVNDRVNAIQRQPFSPTSSEELETFAETASAADASPPALEMPRWQSVSKPLPLQPSPNKLRLKFGLNEELPPAFYVCPSSILKTRTVADDRMKPGQSVPSLLSLRVGQDILFDDLHQLVMHFRGFFRKTSPTSLALPVEEEIIATHVDLSNVLALWKRDCQVHFSEERGSSGACSSLVKGKYIIPLKIQVPSPSDPLPPSFATKFDCWNVRYEIHLELVTNKDATLLSLRKSIDMLPCTIPTQAALFPVEWSKTEQPAQVRKVSSFRQGLVSNMRSYSLPILPKPTTPRIITSPSLSVKSPLKITFSLETSTFSTCDTLPLKCTFLYGGSDSLTPSAHKQLTVSLLRRTTSGFQTATTEQIIVTRVLAIPEMICGEQSSRNSFICLSEIDWQYGSTTHVYAPNDTHPMDGSEAKNKTLLASNDFFLRIDHADSFMEVPIEIGSVTESSLASGTSTRPDLNGWILPPPSYSHACL